MNKTPLRLLKAFTLSVAFFALLAVGQSEARADLVTFSTAGCFGAACAPAPAAATVGSGTATLTFAHQPTTTVDTGTPSGFTIEDLGQLTLGGVGTFSSTPFTLQVIQTAPTPGSGVFGGTLSGTVLSNGSDVRIVFNSTSLTLGNVNYQLVNLTDGNTLFLNGPSTLGGLTRITARITTAVPEPFSLLLLGTGLSGAAAYKRRRRNAA